MSNHSTSNERSSHEEIELTMHLKISAPCLRVLVYLVLALSVSSGFVVAQQVPMLSPQVSAEVHQYQGKSEI